MPPFVVPISGFTSEAGSLVCPAAYVRVERRRKIAVRNVAAATRPLGQIRFSKINGGTLPGRENRLTTIEIVDAGMQDWKRFHRFYQANFRGDLISRLSDNHNDSTVKFIPTKNFAVLEQSAKARKFFPYSTVCTFLGVLIFSTIKSAKQFIVQSYRAARS